MTSTEMNTFSNDESLRSLESLVSEFFSEATSNDRKREIEGLLDGFGRQPDAWRHCLGYLMETRNQYTMVYCLSVLENVVNSKWVSLAVDKSQFRLTVWNFLMTHHRTIPGFVRNKTGKLLVTIAKLDWPHFYCDFVNNILELLNSRESMSLGLMLIQTTIEELTSHRDDLSVVRREELNKLLTDQMPSILVAITSIMEMILDKHVNFLTATPPPSPNHSPDVNDTCYNRGDVLCNAFELSLRKGLLHSIPDIDAESVQISSQALSCLVQIFNWLPSTHYHQINNSLLAAVFVFATFGCTTNHTLNYRKVNSIQLGTLAMAAINELMAKTCISAEATDFIYHIFQNTFLLLQKLIKNDENYSKDSTCDSVNDEYFNKFTEFLKIFISSHFQKFEEIATFPLMEFLGMMFQYTFMQTSCDAFISALEVWTIFFDFVIVKRKMFDSFQVTEKYKEAILSLLTSIIKRIQFKNNQAILEQIDDESIDDDHKTEWQRFFEVCLEIVAKSAEIFPLQTHEQVNQLFQENLASYLNVEMFDKIGADKTGKINLAPENECTLHCSFRDLSSSLKLIGRVADNFIAENFANWFQVAKSIVEKLIQLLVFTNKRQLYTSKLSPKLTGDLIDVHSQILATIKAFSHWMSQYYNQEQAVQTSESVVMITAIVENCIEIIVCDKQTLHSTVPNAVVHSAVHCLYSTTTTIRPSFLFTLSCVQLLYSKICNSFKNELPTNGFKQNELSLSNEDEQLLCRCISNMLLLPWPLVNDSSQDWKSRTVYHNNFVESIVVSMRNLKSQSEISGDFSHVYAISHRSLQLLTDIVENHRESPTRSKQLLYNSIQEAMEMFSNFLVSHFYHPQVAEDCLNFFTSVFDILRNQIALPFVERTIQMMLNLYLQNNVNTSSTEEAVIKNKVVPSFLKMLTFIVQQPGSLFRSFLPGMLSLVLNQIYPAILSGDCPEMKKSFFEFLHHLLLNNWKYFFPNNLIESYSNRSPPNERVQNAQEFVRIMDIFCQSFLTSDICVFKHNLHVLEDLNARLKLFNKHIFKDSMLKHFLCLFLQVLLNKSLNLLNDEIYTIIYHLASVDFDNFLATFIPQFLYNCEGLDDNQRNVLATKCFKCDERDLPSFVSSLNRFVNDLRYYRVCNDFQSTGSIRLQ